MTNKVFTFWEPNDNLPAYLKLCMDTWRINLPEYEIVLLDYSNLSQYIDVDFYDNALFKMSSFAKQADAIRALLLKEQGGIWMDADTILMSNILENLNKIDSEFILFDYHICFIKAIKNAKILNLWVNEAQQRIIDYKKHKITSQIFNKKYYKQLSAWNYLGNGIIDKYLDIANEKIFHKINTNKIMALPERNYYNSQSDDLPNKIYRDFWFNNDLSEYLLSSREALGIFCLHNSWTPKEFKNMTEEQILSKNCTISKILKHILNK